MTSHDILIEVLAACSPVIVAVLSFVAVKVANLINAHVKNAAVAGILTRLDYAVINAVKTVEQSATSAARNADGSLSADSAERAKNAAVAQAKSYLGVDGIKILMQVLGLIPAAADDMIGARVEAAVHDMKNGTLPAAPTAPAPSPTAPMPTPLAPPAPLVAPVIIPAGTTVLPVPSVAPPPLTGGFIDAKLVVLLAVLAYGVLLGFNCAHGVVRDEKTYAAEVALDEANNRDVVPMLEALTAAYRLSKDTKSCVKVAEMALVLKIRGPWHAAKKRQLGGLTNADPGPVPPVPDPMTLCKTSTAGG